MLSRISKTIALMALIALVVVLANSPGQSGRTLADTESAALFGGGNNLCCGTDPACKPQPTQSLDCPTYNDPNICVDSNYQRANPGVNYLNCVTPVQGGNCMPDVQNAKGCLISSNCAWDPIEKMCSRNPGTKDVGFTTTDCLQSPIGCPQGGAPGNPD